MTQFALVADIGGTNARFALYDLQAQTLNLIEKQQVSKEHDLLTLIQAYLAKNNAKVEKACLAIACPIKGDLVSMTNADWSFSQAELKHALGLTRLDVINDFTAVSMSIPALKEDDKVQVGGTLPQTQYPTAIYGAGTGLGVAHLLNVEGRWLSLPGEGGHVDFAAGDNIEDQILQVLRGKFGHVSAERLLSGSGIVNIYQALRVINQQPINDVQPSEIVEKALTGECSFCQRTLALFCAMMGRFGGNLALNLNTRAGVYIAGGIVPRFIDYFKNSAFRQEFENKGRMADLVKDIPVFVITHPDPGLLGAGVYVQSV